MPHLETLLNTDIDTDELELVIPQSNNEINMTPAQIEKEMKRLNGMMGTLVNQRNNYEAAWEDAADYIKPTMYYRTGHTPSNGYPSRRRITNETPTFSLRTLSAGMHSGTTSPARPWFKLLHPDAELNKLQAVKAWLSQVETNIKDVLLRSNIYKALPKLYASLGLFGNGAMIVVDDEDDVVRFHNMTMGQWWAGNDERGSIGVFMLEQQMTVSQIVKTFGKENVSSTVRRDWDDNNNNQSFVKVMWVIERNPDFREGALEAKFKKFRSTYWEKGKTTEGLLSVSGFDLFAALVPRWETDNNDPYGSGPGIDATPGCKGLMLLEKQSSLAHEHLVKPNMTGSASMETAPKTLVPGGINYNDDPNGFRRTFDVQWDDAGTNSEKREIETRIRKMFFEDLFLMLVNEDRSGITAAEIHARQNERMLALGPVLETLQDELLDPLIDLVFDGMDRRDLIPPAPPELAGVKLKIEYVSILAQAQKASDVTVLDRYVGSIGNLADITGDPDVLDNIDSDIAAQEYANLLGPNPLVQRSKEDIQERRDTRAAALQERQELEKMASMADSAKTLSDTSIEDNNALAAVLQGGTV